MVKKIPGVVLSRSGRPRGRPRGSRDSFKRGYTVSEAAVVQRRAASLKHGGSSAIVRKYVSERSPVPALVGDVEVQSLRKDLYVYYLSQGLSEPAMVALDTLASLRAEMDLEKVRADAAGEVLSKPWLEAAKLAIKLTEGLSKLKHGSKQTIEVKQLRGYFDATAESDVVLDVGVVEDE